MLRLTTLGALDLRDRVGQPVRDLLAQPKRIALLVHLVLEGRRGPVPRDKVLAMFWPESDEARARNALSQALYHLRQGIGPDLVESQGTTLSVAADALWCDAVVFDEALARGEVELALDLYKGEFCPALFVSGAAAVEEWVDATRRDQRRRLHDAARQAVRRATEAGDTATAARIARRALALVPEDERDVRLHLAAIDRGGDLTGALALYAEYARRISAELETEPSPETVALVEQMKRRRSAAVAQVREEAPAQLGAGDERRASLERRSPPAGIAAISEPPRRAPGRRRTVLMAVAVVLIGVWGFTASARLGGGGADPGATRAIAVFPFTVRGGDSIAVPGDAMADLLAATLGGLDEVRAIDPRSSVTAAAGATPDPARGAELGRTLGARYFVLGDLVEHAGQLQVNGALYDVRRPERALASASVTGDTAALFGVVDELAGRLLASVVVGRDTSLTQLAAATTASLPALKAYLRGERALRAGLDARAAVAFREAALLDTTFALAQYRLALVANWTTVPGIEDPGVWAAVATRHSTRLTPLGRDLLEAFRAYKLTLPGSTDRYRAIVQSHPDNFEAWYMLAESEFHYGPWNGEPATHARTSFERALALDPNNSHALIHLARIAALEGRRDEVATIAGRQIALNAEADRTIEMRAMLAWARGDTASTRQIRDEAVTADETVDYGLVSTYAAYALDLPAASAIARRVRRRARTKLIGIYMDRMIEETRLAMGRWGEADTARIAAGGDVRWRRESMALAAAERALDVPLERVRALRRAIAADRPYVPLAQQGATLDPSAGEPMRLHLLTLLDLRLGDSAAARVHTDSLRDLLPRVTLAERTAVQVLVLSNESARLRADGKFGEALALAERMPYELFTVRYAHTLSRERFARAELLRALGRDEEALRWYLIIPAFWDLPLLAPARLRAAEQLEKLGQRDEARLRYSQVLEILANADREFRPLVDSARAGLDRIR